MKTKNIARNVAMVLGSSVLTAALVVAGTELIHPASNTGESQGFSSLFEKKEAPTQVLYLEVKNQVITLKGNGSKERYLLLDLAYVANSDESLKAAEHNLPKMKSVLVAMFSGMEYDAVRTMTVDDIHMQMMARYEGVFGSDQPFSDVMISKMVFQ
ncbi:MULTISPECIES: flagellar basal body-associated FliL family protein [unclassified Pantoea]|jgi:flagellar FliL protein|uniref:flagellar basal body-associated FliL family protein n=1 Tax=unclassified Pantoea TaxID=2630326 RepID=UPI0010C9672D|nr:MULTISPECIES: flagellar basal body-associated FliL family protein [unclassified Pantoea]MBY4953617.1 flagellar basal body-associated FliL family protein [Pantoea sp. DY-17]QCP60832.1 flagellar basal body-associated FliL family protein [Pantoea sp. SO10]